MAVNVKPLVLVIMDGWGYREANENNAINQAHKPNFDHLWTQYPHTLVDASGLQVGLPGSQMGNSEVGHVNLGAGRVVYQELTRIDQAIKDQSFFENPELVRAVDAAVAADKAVHLMGLVSPGGVHSHENHIMAMIDLACARGARQIRVHAFLDGRDMPPRSAGPSLEKITAKLNEHAVDGAIVSLCGRYYAMDRDNRWERTERAYRLITSGEADYRYASVAEGVEAAYARDEGDEFVQPTVIAPEGTTPATLEDGDALIYLNFRADRARSLAQAFANKDFDGFERKRQPHTHFVTLTEYASTIEAPVAFRPQQPHNTLGEVLAGAGLHQLRIAETEKYAHVTFFFNGGQEKQFPNEQRILVPSPRVATYDLQPEMSAYALTDKLVEAVSNEQYDVIICNYANADMVGHTGDFGAAVKAVEALDQCLGRLEAALKRVGGEMLVTADHGNSDLMVDPESGGAHTAHTTNPVPLIYMGRNATITSRRGQLCDIAPTMLALLGLPAPEDMTGKPLFEIEEGNAGDQIST